MLAVFSMGICAAAQSDTNAEHPKKSKDEITARGCVERQNGDYVLTQADQGNSYELQGSAKVKRLGPYLGQQVEVTGIKSPSLATSSDSLARAATPVTITVPRLRRSPSGAPETEQIAPGEN